VQEAQLRDGARLLLDARERTEATAFWNGEYDDDELALLKASLIPGRNFLDVGAHVGLVTIPMAAHQLRTETGAVLAIDPLPANIARLRRSLALDPALESRVDVAETALGASSGVVTVVAERPGMTSNARVAAPGAQGSVIYQARLRTLDDVVAEAAFGPVDVIKIDVEGFEFEVLKGAGKCLAESRPLIYGEFHSQLMPCYGADFKDATGLLTPLDYRFFALVSRCEVVEVQTPGSGFGNALLVPSERVSDWQERLKRARAAKRETAS
jgi:FkbM family methyltransferase